MQQIARALSGLPALLVLDNMEHLLANGADNYDGAAVTADLLEHIPTLKCLVTSRRLLNLAGEVEMPVPPLPVPPTRTPICSDKSDGTAPEIWLGWKR